MIFTKDSLCFTRMTSSRIPTKAVNIQMRNNFSRTFFSLPISHFTLRSVKPEKMIGEKKNGEKINQ